MSRASEAAEEIVNVIANGSVKGYVDGTQKMAAIIDSKFSAADLAKSLVHQIGWVVNPSGRTFAIFHNGREDAGLETLTAAIEAWKEGEK